MANAEAGRETGCHRRERFAGAEPPRAFYVCRDIAVSETKPCLATQAFHGVHKIPRFTCQPPAGFGIGDPGQGVHHRIEIRTHTQAEMVEVVAGIHDHRQVVGRQDIRKPKGELGAADAACESEVQFPAYLKRSVSGGRTRSAAQPDPMPQSRPRITTTGRLSSP